MAALSVILDIVLILISLVLIVAVLMQEGQKQGLGAIAGGAETFFGSGKNKGVDAKLAKITKIAAVVFIVLAIATTIVVSHTTKPAADLSALTGVEEAVEGEAEAAVEAVEEGAEAAVEAVEEGAEEAVEAVEEGAEAAVEAVEEEVEAAAAN